MTISSTNTKNSYSGDGSTVAFSYTFKILDDDDIQVILRTNATGTETVQTRTTDYSVSGVGNAGGGTITFVSAPAATETVVLLRNVPLTQTTDYTPNDPFPAVTHEDALDKLTLMAQDTQEEVDRSIKLSRTNTMTSTEFTVGATARANKIFAFDSSGELAVTQEIGTFQGDWAASTAYAERDLVKDTSTNNIFIVNSAHTSSGSQPLTTNTNSSKYDLIVDAASATTSATNAATSATAAAASATAAANSATAAATSETNAAASEAGVAADAAAAAASAASASTSETNASTSETNAATSASAAATSATNAATSATSASNSASSAGTSETNAATSATNASNSASAAATSASNASTSETNAATSESNASTSASSASTSASAAAASAAAAAASFDAFDDIYLGAKASAPTVDNDGDALTNGDLYFDTGDNELYIWNGSAWQAASPNIVADTTPQLGGNLDTNGNDINFGDNDKAIFGAGSDLQIYHTGAGSVIQDAGNGDLFIRGSANVQIEGSTANANMIYATEGGAVRLYYDANQKLATGVSGIDVTGTVTADAATLSGTSPVLSYSDTDNSITAVIGSGTSDFNIATTSAHNLDIRTNNTRRMVVESDGDISFYDSTGVTQGLFWDASTQRLGLGTTSPGTTLDVVGNVRSNAWIGRTNSSAPTADAAVYRAADNTVAFSTANTERLRIDSSGNVGIGTSSPSSQITLKQSAQNFAGGFRLERSDNTNNFTFAIDGSTKLNIGYNDSTKLVLDSSGNVGIGTSSPQEQIHSAAGGSNALRVSGGANDNKKVEIGYDNTNGPYIKAGSSGITGLQFYVDNTSLAATIDSSGNLLVGKTATGVSNYGFAARGVDGAEIARDDGTVLFMNRGTSDGTIVDLRKDNTTVGGIGTEGGDLTIGTGNTGFQFYDFSSAIRPWNFSSNTGRDNAIDLGTSGDRYDDIYATNGTIQTSDANEKQDIETLSDAEQRVAVAAKGLLRKYRWINSAAEKGDDARIHFGIIAQDLKAAFEAEGLDAGRYAMFINSEWTDEETGEPRSRMGVRYNQLLAFIIAAI